MPPIIALLSCIIFVIFLIWTDLKKSDDLSAALWVPLAWMFIAGSRFPTGWLSMGSSVTLQKASTSLSFDEGSPVDAAVFLILIVSGVFVLFKREIDWRRLLIQNKWICLYFIYCAISVIWSDFPYITLKRWIKELGNPIMVLVILTEKYPYEAIGAILRRLAFLILPLSVVFIKYYPDLGRAYSADFILMNIGVTQQKNQLGLMCMITGIYFIWNFFLGTKNEFKLRNNYSFIVVIGILVWLLGESQSATSLACLLVAASLIFLSSTKFIGEKANKLIVVVMIVAALTLLMEVTLDVTSFVIARLGRNPNLTYRVPMWEMLMSMAGNSIIGTGFMSFWAGERLITIASQLRTNEIIQAHNGYLEQYLNLGYIGVLFVVVMIMSGVHKVLKHSLIDYPSAVLRLTFILVASIYNYTEASFYGINNMWLLLLLVIFDVSGQQHSKSLYGDNPIMQYEQQY
jgi:exopolysaccharide production protein ExoQ